MTQYERIERVIRYVGERHHEQPRLETLARVAGLSVSHFQRVFSRWAGATPKDFLKFVTSEHAKELLRASRDVLSVSLEAGLSGPGRLHDLLVTVEGLSPGEFKAAGSGVEIRHGVSRSPFGACLIAWTARGICHLSFLDGAKDGARALRRLRERFPHARFAHAPREAARAAADAFGRRKAFRVAVPGTPFQLKVWQALLRVPAGLTLSYGDIAAAIGRPSACRAVAGAVARNDVAFLIPCHRVIRESGVIGGYRWGSARKRAMLAWESAWRSRIKNAPAGTAKAPKIT